MWCGRPHFRCNNTCAKQTLLIPDSKPGLEWVLYQRIFHDWIPQPWNSIRQNHRLTLLDNQTKISHQYWLSFFFPLNCRKWWDIDCSHSQRWGPHPLMSLSWWADSLSVQQIREPKSSNHNSNEIHNKTYHTKRRKKIKKNNHPFLTFPRPHKSNPYKIIFPPCSTMKENFAPVLISVSS